ncbi:hypothetical protein V6N12_035980 [Hibiscus sabdariffa]|uniref:Uncharacterized protein n=1 Tax=Hibiscus sabdariffa TaxID=183260 RepID=A0ABR2EPB3_9ROSI
MALGKDARLFFEAVAYLLISIVGSLTDFLTLGYTTICKASIPLLAYGEGAVIGNLQDFAHNHLDNLQNHHLSCDRLEWLQIGYQVALHSWVMDKLLGN